MRSTNFRADNTLVFAKNRSASAHSRSLLTARDAPSDTYFSKKLHEVCHLVA
jgi:hypothetical protein